MSMGQLFNCYKVILELQVREKERVLFWVGHFHVAWTVTASSLLIIQFKDCLHFRHF